MKTGKSICRRARPTSSSSPSPFFSLRYHLTNALFLLQHTIQHRVQAPRRRAHVLLPQRGGGRYQRYHVTQLGSSESETMIRSFFLPPLTGQKAFGRVRAACGADGLVYLPRCVYRYFTYYLLERYTACFLRGLDYGERRGEMGVEWCPCHARSECLV